MQEAVFVESFLLLLYYLMNHYFELVRLYLVYYLMEFL